MRAATIFLALLAIAACSNGDAGPTKTTQGRAPLITILAFPSVQPTTEVAVVGGVIELRAISTSVAADRSATRAVGQ